MGNVIASMAGQKETASEKEETASEKKAGQKEEDKKPLLTDVDEDEDDDEYDVDEDEDDDEYDVLRDGPSADDMFGNCGVLAVLFETPPGHTPYGFAIFEYDAVKLTEPDAWQHIWADFIGDLKAVIWPEAFLNFGCKGDAITDTDVSKDLSLMIQNHVADGQTLAVGNEGYEKVIQDRLKISCVYSPAVKELMWGLMIQIKNFLPVINSEMINLDRFPMSDGMIFFLKSHKFDINPHMMVTKKIIELAGVMYECDHCVNKYDAVLDMFADELMEISGITTSDWDSLKLVTALKIICEPEDEIRNARKLFSEQQLEKLMKDAPQYKDVILKDPALEIYKEMNSARNLSVKVSRVMVRLLEQAKKAYENEQGGKAASDPEICPPRKKICLGFAPVMNELKERQVPPTIAPVDALQRCTQISTHPLNMMNRPGISSMDIHPLKVGQPSGQEGYVSTSFHQGGLILGTGTLDGSVKIWDVKTQTAGLDGVKIWDLRTYGDPVAFDLSNYNSDTPINAGNKDWSALLFGLLAAFHGNKQGLDLIAKTMDADDKCWTIHLAYRPELVNFRNGQPANLEQQDVMLRKAHVTGESAAIPGEETGEKYEGAILLDGAEAGKKTTLGKRKLGGFFDGSSCGKDDSVPTMKEFFRMVRESGVEEGTDLMFTACKLALKREHRELLGAFATNAGRLDYLTRTHAEMNK